MKRLLISTLMTFVVAGCHTIDKDKGVERDWLGREKEIEYQTPAKIVAIWTNSVFNEAGKLPVRGLGGRIYFYDGEHRAIPVDGKLSIFLYDDSNGDQHLKQEASRVVHFSPEEVRSNYTPSEFGASYSFWVPWDAVGGERTKLGVIPVFTDTAGRMIVGEQAGHLLPGTEPVETEKDDQLGDVIQASHTSDQSSVSRSTRIKLPKSMQERVKILPRKRESRGKWDIHNRTKVSDRLNDSNTRIASLDVEEETQAQVQAEQLMAQHGADQTADEKPSEAGGREASFQRPSTRSLSNRRQVPSSPYVRRLADRAQSLLAPGERLFAPE